VHVSASVMVLSGAVFCWLFWIFVQYLPDFLVEYARNGFVHEKKKKKKKT
jgi:hypothetical protein